MTSYHTTYYAYITYRTGEGTYCRETPGLLQVQLMRPLEWGADWRGTTWGNQQDSLCDPGKDRRPPSSDIRKV